MNKIINVAFVRQLFMSQTWFLRTLWMWNIHGPPAVKIFFPALLPGETDSGGDCGSSHSDWSVEPADRENSAGTVTSREQTGGEKCSLTAPPPPERVCRIWGSASVQTALLSGWGWASNTFSCSYRFLESLFEINEHFGDVSLQIQWVTLTTQRNRKCGKQPHWTETPNSTRHMQWKGESGSSVCLGNRFYRRSSIQTHDKKSHFQKWQCKLCKLCDGLVNRLRWSLQDWLQFPPLTLKRITC